MVAGWQEAKKGVPRTMAQELTFGKVPYEPCMSVSVHFCIRTHVSSRSEDCPPRCAVLARLSWKRKC